MQTPLAVPAQIEFAQARRPASAVHSTDRLWDALAMLMIGVGVAVGLGAWIRHALRRRAA